MMLELESEVGGPAAASVVFGGPKFLQLLVGSTSGRIGAMELIPGSGLPTSSSKVCLA